MSVVKLPAEGGCLCGQVRIRVSASPVMSLACHCRGCQRMTSSAFSLAVAIPAPAFEVTKGEPVIGALHGPTPQYYCPNCMSWLFTRSQVLDDMVMVRPTILDDVRWARPFVETYTSEKLPWVKTTAVHSYERFPPPGDFQRLMAEYEARRGT
jgi:hypothetical protein